MTEIVKRADTYSNTRKHQVYSLRVASELTRTTLSKQKALVMFLYMATGFLTSVFTPSLSASQEQPNITTEVVQSVASNSNLSQTKSAEALFANYASRLYQVRTIDKAADSKASIGSAFLIGDDGVLATNYHVVSQFILKPEKYYLEVLDHNLNRVNVDVLRIDVINDLALLKLQADTPDSPIPIAATEPAKGASIYSLGNPRDLGMTVVPGTYNGRTAHAFYDRILFSGSINPGMSGGPVLNEQGEVIGVNVATSGNQLSFLVPLPQVQNLIDLSIEEQPNFKQQSSRQLSQNQERLMNQILQGDWSLSPLGSASVLGELTDFINCWGESDEAKDERFKHVFRRCRNNEYIYIGPNFSTGILEMEFYYYSTDKMNNWQFFKMLNDSFGSVSAGNAAGEDHVTEFECHDDLVHSKKTSHQTGLDKMVYCVRQYKNYPDLYDVVFLSASLHEEQSSLISHYTLAGINKDNAQAFLKRFLGVL